MISIEQTNEHYKWLWQVDNVLWIRNYSDKKLKPDEHINAEKRGQRRVIIILNHINKHIGIKQF